MNRREVSLLTAALLLAMSLFAPFGNHAGAGAFGGDEIRVVLFYDPAYVDTVENGNGEAFNLAETLRDLGIEPVLVPDLATADFADLLVDTDALIMPEMNGQLVTDNMTADQFSDIRTYVANGGRVETFGSANPFPWVNELISTTFTYNDNEEAQCGEDFEQIGPPTCSATATKASTEFADGPSMLRYNNDTYGGPLTFVADADTRVIYEDDATGAATVFVQGFGAGSVMFYAWDWFFDDDEPTEPIDEGWFDVFALSLGVGVTVDDVSVTEGQTATFTIRLDSPASQDVAIDFTTVDGTAKAGVDYTARTGTAIVEAGATSVTVSVDTMVVAGTQGSRQFTLEIATPLWGITLDAEGVGTISDPAPTTTTTARPGETVTPRFTG